MLTLILLAVLVMTATLAVVLWRGIRRLDHLITSPLPSQPPRVSIVVAARNEGTSIEPAMRSLLNQSELDADSEVIAINDRSEDDTGEILARMAKEDQRLRVIAIEAVPEGWLGKNHALWQGAREARGDWLLFTDADVVMGSEAVARGVGYGESHQLHHVTAVPAVTASSPLLRILILQFAISFMGFFRPWRMADDRRCYAGIGAFNLVDAASYRAVDGHRSIALTPLDDVLLGRRLRRNGARSRMLDGQGALQLQWYPDARHMIRGLRKNGFAAFDYRVSRLIAATAIYAVMGLLPWLALAAPEASDQWLAAANVAMATGLQAWFAERSGWPWYTALLSPMGTAIIIWAWWRAAMLTLWEGGIDWRGTRYPLGALRAQHDDIAGRNRK